MSLPTPVPLRQSMTTTRARPLLLDQIAFLIPIAQLHPAAELTARCPSLASTHATARTPAPPLMPRC